MDGYLFPVSRNLDLFVQTDPDEPDSVLVSGVYERYRDCTLVRANWYYGKPGERSIAIDSVRLTSPSQIINSDGPTSWGPTRLHIRLADFYAGTYAVAVHDCYNGFFWKTETLIYQSIVKLPGM